MKNIELTIQNAGNGKFRFGVSTKDSKEYFFYRGRKVRIKLAKNFVIETKTSCGVKSFIKPDNDDLKKRKKGYDFNSKYIDSWIKQNGLQEKFIGKRRPIVFKLRLNEDWIILTYNSVKEI